MIDRKFKFVAVNPCKNGVCLVKNMYFKNSSDQWECRAQTREQQHLCKLGQLDEFDDHCQFMGHGCICNLGGLVQDEKGFLVRHSDR